MDYFLIGKNEIILIVNSDNSDNSCSDGDEKEEKTQDIGVPTRRRKMSLISSNALHKHNFN
jgi:hypothetical protein